MFDLLPDLGQPTNVIILSRKRMKLKEMGRGGVEVFSLSFVHKTICLSTLCHAKKQTKQKKKRKEKTLRPSVMREQKCVIVGF